jgi:UTP--glucose-1-phosphate uridylyltransferase
MGGVRVRKAVIPAAGLGTRFLPATKAIPKEMLPIVDVPTIQLIVEEAIASGIEEIVLVTSRGKHAIEDHFDVSYELEHTLRERHKEELLRQVTAISQMARVVAVRQKEPLGLGHAVLAAREVVGDEAFAVLLGDDLIDHTDGHMDGSGAPPGARQLVDEFERAGGEAAVVALMEVAPGEEQLYGVVAGEATSDPRLMRVREMVEKPPPGTAPSRMAIIGRYVLPSTIWAVLERTPPGRGGEIQLTDALRTLAVSGGGCYGYRFRGTRHDAGDRLGYLRANLAYALKRGELRDGVLAMLREVLDQEAGPR